MKKTARQQFKRRVVFLIVIVLVHAALLWALAGTDVSSALFSPGEHTSPWVFGALLCLLFVRLYCFFVLPGAMLASAVLAMAEWRALRRVAP